MANVGTNTRKQQNDLIEQALSAKHSGNRVLAMELYEEAIKLGDQGSLAPAYYNKGVLAMEGNHHTEALMCFQEAVALNPDYEKAWLNLGCVQLFFQNHKEALYAFERAHTILPDQIRSLFNRAYTLNRLNRFQEANTILKNLISREEKVKDVILELGESDYKLYSEAGLSSLQLGDMQNALHFFRKAFNLNTSEYQICYNIAFIYDHVKDFQQAILFYDLSIALAPDEYKAYQGKACTYIHMQRFDEALQWITHAINIDPDNFEAYYNLACIYAGQKEKQNMVNAIHKTIALAPEGVDLRPIFRNDADFASYVNDPAFVSAIQ